MLLFWSNSEKTKAQRAELNDGVTEKTITYILGRMHFPVFPLINSSNNFQLGEDLKTVLIFLSHTQYQIPMLSLGHLPLVRLVLLE